MLGDNVNAKADFGSNENPVLDQLVAQGDQSILSPQDRGRVRNLDDLLGFCKKFILDSNSWRRQSFETDWHLFQRNADSIYDPALLARKESWQSRGFIPTTASHRENIQAALFRMLVGARPPLELRARIERQDDQSDNIRDLILREMEKSRFEVEVNKVLEDASTYGSGFCRIRYETKTEDRVIRNPQHRVASILNPSSIIQSLQGKSQLTGYGNSVQRVETYRGVRFEHLNIWDIFPEPKALKIKGNNIAYRFKWQFGEIVQGVKEGWVFPEALSRLRNAPSREIEPVEKNIVLADRGIAPSNPMRTQYSKRIECYELYARLPKRWVLVRGEQIDDPDALVSARVLFSLDAILSVELNDDYEGEPPIYKMDYLPVGGRFYGRGVPEMLKAIQEVINETVNQRVDNVSLVLNRMFAVIESAVIDREDFVSKPGGFIRLDGRKVTDIRQAFTAIEIPDVTVSAYKDVQEMERYAQERTSANRVTLGTNGLANDANRTATGLEILRQSAGEKFAYIGMLMEFDFLYNLFRAYWKTLYANIRPEDVIDGLGPERAGTFKLLTPEDIEKQYIYEPQGIFTMENKALTQQRIGGLYQQFMGQPWLNPMACFDKEAKAANLDPDSLKYSPDEMQQMMQAQAHMQMANGPQQGPQGPQMPQGPSNAQAGAKAVAGGKVSLEEATRRMNKPG